MPREEPAVEPIRHPLSGLVGGLLIAAAIIGSLLWMFLEGGATKKALEESRPAAQSSRE